GGAHILRVRARGWARELRGGFRGIGRWASRSRGVTPRWAADGRQGTGRQASPATTSVPPRHAKPTPRREVVMSRVRRAGPLALTLAVVQALLVVSLAAAAAHRPAPRAIAEPRAVGAAVAWPTSTLVVSEGQTGGASASDEFAELSNAGTAPVDLIGLE